ncbi:hypothetical protein [Micromonospora cathayae]|uniref:Uncharacterized protein n=1 Tax=Micromonospora cathayae TaxID=3028804 RepID=A0ABY7ZW66_9ACTN|nr:hypothetical protein [Micromonospora sp. HUAS 3]WDZ86703.1 hypothetical protein PVK37_10050 [Micromonospora sp. HUAS 3]
MTTSAVDVAVEPGTGRALTVAQFALTAAYLVAVVVALGRAASFAGHFYLPYQGDAYTGDADLWPGAWRQAQGLLVLGLAVVPLVAAGTVLAALGRLRHHPRSRSLVVGTVGAVLVVVASLTPALAALRGWVVD